MMPSGIPEKYEADFAEMRKIDHEANLFALIRTVEHLENSYANGKTSVEGYEIKCSQLLSQFSSYEAVLREAKMSLDLFIEQNGMYCPRAKDRLQQGIPATRLSGTLQRAAAGFSSENATFFQLSAELISLLDAIHLGVKAVDRLLPDLERVLCSLSDAKRLPLDLRGLPEIRNWKLTLLKMGAHEELTENQCRQLALDLDTAYESLKRWLSL